jgi:hypothetical protein
MEGWKVGTLEGWNGGRMGHWKIGMLGDIYNSVLVSLRKD